MFIFLMAAMVILIRTLSNCQQNLKEVLLLNLIDYNHQQLGFIFCSVHLRILYAQPFQSSSHGGWIKALQNGAVPV